MPRSRPGRSIRCSARSRSSGTTTTTRRSTASTSCRSCSTRGDEPFSLDIYVAQIVEAEASLRLVFNGRWLQIYGAGTDWTRAKAAYDAAQVEIALVAGITTFKLPKLPPDTVTDVRKRVGAKDRDPGRLGGDEQPPRPGV